MATLLVPAGGGPAGAGEVAGERYVDPIFEVAETEDVVYGDNVPLVDGATERQDLHLDLFEPAGDTETSRPVVVVVHGGGFCGGSKRSNRIRQHARHLTERGWVTASIEYRYNDDCDDAESLTAATRDARAAVRWFRANASDLRIDETRIAMLGYSAGAFVAIGVAFGGDPANGNGPQFSGNAGHSSRLAAAISHAGATYSPNPRPEAPVQIVHGDQDGRVPFDGGIGSGQYACERIRAAEGTCEFVVHEGAGHGLYTEYLDEDNVAFLRQCMASYGGFPDVPNAEGDLDAAVGWMAEWAITTGYADGRFHPENAMNRQQVAAFLHRLAGAPDPGEGSGFPDVPADSPFAAAIAWLASTGITQGYGDGTFRPTNPVTRQQLAAFLWRALGEPPPPEGAPAFPDVPADHPFVEAIAWLASTGITQGYGDGTFRPDDAVTRLSAAIFLWRLGRLDAAWDGPVARPEAACSNVDLTR